MLPTAISSSCSEAEETFIHGTVSGSVERGVSVERGGSVESQLTFIHGTVTRKLDDAMLNLGLCLVAQ